MYKLLTVFLKNFIEKYVLENHRFFILKKYEIKKIMAQKYFLEKIKNKQKLTKFFFILSRFLSLIILKKFTQTS